MSLLKTTATAIALASALSAAAQQPTTAADTDVELRTQDQLDADTYLANELSSVETDADIDVVQFGDRNAAEIQTFSQGGVNSQVTIAQVGAGSPPRPVSDNDASIILNGDGNDFSIVQQGNGNIYNGNVTATDADVIVLQRGDFNDIQQQSTLVDEASLLLQQDGNGNRLDANDYEGVQGRQIIVRQTGGAAATLLAVAPAPR